MRKFIFFYYICNMNTNPKYKLISRIRFLVKASYNIDIDIETGGYRISDIRTIEGGTFAYIFKDDEWSYKSLNQFKYSTLYDILNKLQYIVEYNRIIEKLSSKNDHWDGKKWTHKPIDENKVRKMVLSNINGGTHGRYTASSNKTKKQNGTHKKRSN